MITTQNGHPGMAPEVAGKQVGETNRSVPPAGDTPRPLAGWCPPGGCTTRSAAELEHAVTLAFEAGRAYERAELAEQHELWWKTRPAKALGYGRDHSTYERQVAGRIAVMEAAAARFAVDLAEKHGRMPWAYNGGPVDWHTGRPLRESTSQTSHESGPSHLGSGVAA
ncbi:hypothetical protein [Micromonospora sp. DH14]|uniref:hypothetical protein n=1 Tax=Micromonospora sp. DH14 TaxID=3040120 RepID=UPI002441FF33|nr:hypothetical protein [Micromonospora sp. DH14]MDG9673026.1 hypothetical protein [Micromonospora sp. DH14]